MPFCRKCRYELKKTDIFCPSCGTPNVLSSDKQKEVVDGAIINDKSNSSKNTQQKISKRNDQTILSNAGSYGIINMEELEPGFMIDERYEIKEFIGAGAFGCVYKVYDNDRKMNKALKLIYPIPGGDAELAERLRTEIAGMDQFSNYQHIVKSYDFHSRGKLKFIDMEYIEGASLRKLLDNSKDNKLSEEIALKTCMQIAEGMIEIHKHKIIHKDLKPENILFHQPGKNFDVNKSFIAKITDFGISEKVRNTRSRLEETSRSGTRYYMSPEQLSGRKVGKEADIWSFGVMMYEMLSGDFCFKGETTEELMFSIREILDVEKDRKTREMTQFGSVDNIAGISENIILLINKCLKYNYHDRYRDFGDLANSLKQSGTQYPKAHIKREVIFSSNKTVDKHNNMIFVQGGTFQMGSNDGNDDQKPLHAVTVSDFYIGKTEVTQREWKNVIGNHSSHFKGDNLPVEIVSWYDAVKYCNKKSRSEGLNPCYSGNGTSTACNFSANGYRLPTEAEWEFAARGGSKKKSFSQSRYEDYKYSGNNDIESVAWYIKNSESKTHPVGKKQANELGIYDMSGNVWEWCNDWYVENYYSTSLKNDPQGANSGKYSVLRGGSWFDLNSNCRVALRIRLERNFSNYDIGFRIVRNP